MARPKMKDSERTKSITVRVKNWVYDELLKGKKKPRVVIQELAENYVKEKIDKKG